MIHHETDLDVLAAVELSSADVLTADKVVINAEGKFRLIIKKADRTEARMGARKHLENRRTELTSALPSTWECAIRRHMLDKAVGIPQYGVAEHVLEIRATDTRLAFTEGVFGIYSLTNGSEFDKVISLRVAENMGIL